MPPPTPTPASPARILLLIGAVAALGAWAGSRLAGSLGPGGTGRPAHADLDRTGRRGAVRPDVPPEPSRARPAPPAGPDASRAAAADRTPGGDGTGAPPGTGEAPGGPPRSEVDEAAAQRLSSDMRRLVRDLEFNAGLPEPPQQLVVPPPAPWRPDPVAAGLPPPAIVDLEPRAAPASGGARVTIRGRNLRPVQVMFGAAAARIVAATGEAVTVLAPRAGAGPVTVSVTNDDGSYAVAGVPFTYRD